MAALTLTLPDLKGLFAAMRDTMVLNKDYLIELDGVMGDGDLGLTMSNAFSAAALDTAALEEPDLGKVFIKGGMAMAKAAPSTMGTLMATGMMRGGKALTGRQEITLEGFTAMLRAFEEGVMNRGKAKPGERTLLDSLDPAALALEKAGSASVSEGLRIALAAAEAGVEATKPMEPVWGRAVYHKENALGAPDQGALVGMLFIKGFHDYAAQ
jgi:dihydroxyacetone kinase-like protein